MQDDWTSEVYGNYRQWKGWAARTRHSTDWLLYEKELARSGIAAPGRLLEIGYGDGDFLRYAQSHGYRCSGIEIVDDSIDSMQNAGIDARLGTVAELAEGSFDLIAAFDVFEHMSAPDLLRTLKECARVLGPHGRLIARFPNAGSPFGVFTQHGDITHRLALSGDSYFQLAQLAGFTMVFQRNAAWTWRGNSVTGSLLKPLSIVLRRCIEVFLGIAYHGRLRPMDPEIVVLLERGASGVTHPKPATVNQKR